MQTTQQQQQEAVRNVDDCLAKKFAGRKLPRKGSGLWLDPKSQLEAGSFPFFLDLVEKLRWFQPRFALRTQLLQFSRPLPFWVAGILIRPSSIKGVVPIL